MNDFAFSVQQTRDGGYVAAGVEHGNGLKNEGNAWVLRLDPKGAVLWKKTFPLGWAYSVEQTRDAGYVVAGHKTKKPGQDELCAWVLKLDSEGNREWEKTFGSCTRDRVRSVQQTRDGGYVLAGFATDQSGLRFRWVFKLDAKGRLVWQRTFKSPWNTEARSVQQTRDGGYVVSGDATNDATSSLKMKTAAWVCKLEPNGTVRWERTFSWKTGPDASANSVQQTRDGGYVVVGTGASPQGDKSRDHHVSWMWKLDSVGRILWKKALVGNAHGSANLVRETRDQGYVVAGWNLKPDAPDEEAVEHWLRKLDRHGTLLWKKALPGQVRAVQQTTDGGYVVAGQVYTERRGYNEFDAWILKLGVTRGPADPEE